MLHYGIENFGGPDWADDEKIIRGEFNVIDLFAGDSRSGYSGGSRQFSETHGTWAQTEGKP